MVKIPKKLEKFIESGKWPNKKNISLQYENPIVDSDLVKIIFPGEDQIYFFNPPFLTIQELIDRGDDFYLSPEVNDSLKQIDPKKAIVIADFGMGSEAELILDYSIYDENPRVLKLEWNYNDIKLIRKAKWVLVSPTFDVFCETADFNRLVNKGVE